MLDILADGEPHSRKELHACLPDELQALRMVADNIARIRKYLKTIDQNVLCVVTGTKLGLCYQRVKTLKPRKKNPVARLESKLKSF